uniref:NADH dehydrogenase subunit 2 n=1 Tax=Acavomonas peruviana TaxID=1542312 RepID=V5KVG5_9ALVE|nr:NADH dehydrogenase subunit 2 [Acavomonas peruviana]AHA41682.1 NADH dehydrogenase subunit 2 [Acavomonas peruviana]
MSFVNYYNFYGFSFVFNFFFFFFSLVCFSFFFYKEVNNNINSYIYVYMFINLFFVDYSLEYFFLMFFSFFIIFYKYFLDKKPVIFMIFVFIFLSFYLIINSFDFIVFLFSMELQAFLTFALLMSNQSNVNSFLSVEGGVKFFILNGISSGFLLYSIALFYGLVGSINFYDFYIFSFFFNFYDTFFFNYAFFFFMVSLFFKLGVAPYHIWLPDIYGSLSYFIISFFSVFPKMSILFFIYKFFSTYFINLSSFFNFFFFISIFFSIIVGTVGSFSQNKFKYFFAYTSINASVFYLIGFTTGTVEGQVASLIYFSVYSVMNMVFFYLILNSSTKIYFITDFSKLSLTYKFFFVFMFFSISGFPPFGGFWIKYMVFDSLVFNSYYSFYVIFALGSVLNMIYYLRLIKIISYDSYKIININFYNSFSSKQFVNNINFFWGWGFIFTLFYYFLYSDYLSLFFINVIIL